MSRVMVGMEVLLQRCGQDESLLAILLCLCLSSNNVITENKTTSYNLNL